MALARGVRALLLLVLGCTQADTSCPDCSIEIEPVVELGDAGAIEWDSHVVAVRGGYIAAPAQHSAGLAVFGGDGELTRTLGRKGQGPGEFSGIRSIAAGEDGLLFVSDASGLVVLDSTLGYVRSIPTPSLAREITPLARDRIVVHFQRVGSSQHPLAMIDWDDDSLTLFGGESAGTPYAGVRQVVWWLDGVATIREFEYLVEVYSRDGVLLNTHRVIHPWFSRPATVDELPKARVVDATVVDGRLWTLSYRERKEWKPESVARAGGHGTPVKLSASQMRERYEQRLDVVDLSGAADLVASIVDPEQNLMRFGGGGYLLALAEGEEDLKVSLLSMRLVRP